MAINKLIKHMQPSLDERLPLGLQQVDHDTFDQVQVLGQFLEKYFYYSDIGQLFIDVNGQTIRFL